MTEIIQGRDITIRLNAHTILDRVDFSIGEGECVGLFGTSGAGKSTLLRAILGFHRIDEGELIFEGVNRTRDQRCIRRYVSLATQEGSFYPKLSVIENLRYFAKLYGIEDHTRIENILDDLSLQEYRTILSSNLSGGTQKRFEIGLSLLINPVLLLLDEPGSGLDIITKKEIYALIARLRDSGTSVLLTSHDPGGIKEYLTHCYVMHAGQISPKFDVSRISDMNRFFEHVVLR